MGEADEMLTFEQCGSKLTGQRCHPLERERSLRSNGLHAIEQPIHQTVKHCITISDVPVDGRHSNAEIVGETPHRESVDSVSLDDVACDLKDLVGSDRSTITIDRFTAHTSCCTHGPTTAG